MSIREHRKVARRLLNDSSPLDAPTAYYALFHDPRRSILATRVDERGRPLGFAGRFQTGHDLFRPLVTLRCANSGVAGSLLAEILTPGRPYILFVSAQQFPVLGDNFTIEHQRALHIYHLDRARFQPTVNVLVVERAMPDGLPRFEINSGGLQAVAGINWVSPAFAEIFVHTEELAQKRGWGRSVAAACTEYVLRDARQPLYLVESSNQDSIALAKSLGYVDTGARQIYADVIYQGSTVAEHTPVKENQDASKSGSR